jgi:hypothetical protein
MRVEWLLLDAMPQTLAHGVEAVSSYASGQELEEHIQESTYEYTAINHVIIISGTRFLPPDDNAKELLSTQRIPHHRAVWMRRPCTLESPSLR